MIFSTELDLYQEKKKRRKEEKKERKRERKRKKERKEKKEERKRERRNQDNGVGGHHTNTSKRQLHIQPLSLRTT